MKTMKAGCLWVTGFFGVYYPVFKQDKEI